MRIDMTFNDWFKEVEEYLQRISGMRSEELRKKSWHDWYDEGYTPLQATETALLNNGFHIDENYYLG
jgi:hypothetical protein